MRIENLKNYILDDVTEIKCSRHFLSELNEYPNAVIKNNNSYDLYYKGIPVSVDESIRILDECNLIYKNSVETNFYDKIIKNLKQEAEKLNNKLTIIRESTNSANSSQSTNNNMNFYIATLKSLRETLDLISKYDWRLMYSEYDTNKPIKHWTEVIQESNPSTKQISINGGDGNKQIAVWEQNHDNQIRNHKIWNVDVTLKEKVPMYIDFGMIKVDLDENSKNMGICTGKAIIYYMDSIITLTCNNSLIRDYANEIEHIN